MNVIADYAKTIRGLQTDGNGINMQQLEKLEELTRKAITQNPSIAKVFPLIDSVPLPVGTLPNGYIRSSPLPQIGVPRDWRAPPGRVQTVY